MNTAWCKIFGGGARRTIFAGLSEWMKRSKWGPSPFFPLGVFSLFSNVLLACLLLLVSTSALAAEDFNSLSVVQTSTNPTSGTPGSAIYTVTSTVIGNGGNPVSCTLTISPVLPWLTGVTGSFSPAKLDTTVPTVPPLTSTLTLATSAATPAGSTPFTVTCIDSHNSQPWTANGTLTVNAISASNFNAFETSTAAGAITGVIQTKIAGSAFGLDVVAISGGAKATGFTKAVKVELLGNTVTGIALDAQNCPTSYTVLQTVSPNPTITAGRSTVNFAAVANAWMDVRVRISYPAGAPTVISCSTDDFAIRPNSLSVSATDADWQTAGATRMLNYTSTTGPGCIAVNTPIGCAGTIHKAGQPFTVQVTAVNAAAATTTNYTGTPGIVLSACAGSGCTATFGTFSIGTGTAVAGVINSTTATYSEVGAFTLQLQDQTFASVDAADGTTANCAGQYVCSSMMDVGRFVPDHFSLSAASITNRADLACPACTFTYMGEQMNAVFTLTAQAAGSTTTLNYAGVLAKLNPAAAGNPLVFGAVDNAATRTPLTARLDTSLPTTGGFVAGVAAAVSAPLGIVRCTAVTCPANTKPNREDGSYAALDVGIAPVDGDGAAMAAYDLDTTNVVSTTNDHTKVARTEVRYGRIKLSNAHGSELLSLPITATVQYWNSASYVTSVTDSATQFNTKLTTAGGDVQAVIVKGPLALANISVITPGLVTFANGVNTFKLGAPNVAGSADLTIITAPSYLLPSTTGRATFGVYKGANGLIYLRENY